ncbi:HIT family protein [Dictyobacter arantiisoli]|uniref:HIT domain-containing protein n=1 Tax=Dictyobacter arantiisoli TaxID=2014874 RepID=A0A5A5TJ89_9CHLR|nr:HIT family protein [Dictyobacter arantiisoli]GCF11487.1 hypothetical protein KDI_50510 [Dictyobacter arantiisoli]
MQHQSSVSRETQTIYSECTFCQTDAIASLVMKETPNFRLVADHAPLLAGHILIIPKQHYACYGTVPATLDEELFSLKREVQRFFARYYAPPAYWEHGIFHQTVFHAHLHCFPIGPINYPSEEQEQGKIILRQDDIRQWYSQYGHYFYLEDAQQATIFPPLQDVYSDVVKTRLGPAVAAHSPFTTWRTAQERQLEGKPLIAALLARWHEFQSTEYTNLISQTLE